MTPLFGAFSRTKTIFTNALFFHCWIPSTFCDQSLFCSETCGPEWNPFYDCLCMSTLPRGTCFSGSVAIWNQATSSLCAYFWTNKRRTGWKADSSPHPPAAQQAWLRHPLWLREFTWPQGEGTTGNFPNLPFDSISCSDLRTDTKCLGRHPVAVSRAAESGDSSVPAEGSGSPCPPPLRAAGSPLWVVREKGKAWPPGSKRAKGPSLDNSCWRGKVTPGMDMGVVAEPSSVSTPWRLLLFIVPV